MIFRTENEVHFQTNEEFQEINKMSKELKRKSKGNIDLYKKWLQEYFDSFPTRDG